jgi:TonB-linked SusC/RagA family outer membrane protein
MKGEALKEVPVSTASGALSGRMAGIIALQNSGEPGQDGTTIRIRGVSTIGDANALIIVDGVERDMNSINPSDIENISVLKDAASVAPYGMRGANGVVLITTKRGSPDGKFSLTYAGSRGFQRPTQLPEMLSSYDWASQKNIAARNSGEVMPFSNNDLQQYQDGTDLDRYPNDNVLDKMIDWAAMNKHDVSVTGGNDKMNFFGSLGYFQQEGNWGRATNFQRYNMRVNVDAKVTPTTKIGFDIAGSYEDELYPGAGSASHIIFGFFRLNPTNPIFYTNGKPAGYFERNPYQDVNASGYTKVDDYRSAITFSIEQKLPFVSGLSVNLRASLDKRDELIKNWKIPYSFYQIENDNSFSEFKGNTQQPTLMEGYTLSRRLNLQFLTRYERVFGKHGVNAVLVFEPRKDDRRLMRIDKTNYLLNIDELFAGSADRANTQASGFSGQQAQVGYAYRISYAYNEKYLLEAGGRYDGSYYYAPGKRFAFLPSFSAGWRISEESFFPKVSFLSSMKIRGSWGISGAIPDPDNPYQFLRGFNITGIQYLFGGNAVSGLTERSEPNPFITWEKARKTDIGIDAEFFDGQLTLEFDYFSELRDNMLINPAISLPSEYGIGFGTENKGTMKNHGIDFSIGYGKTFANEIRFTSKVNFTYAKNELVNINENDVTRNDPYRSRTGRPLGRRFGLQSLGYFQNQEEIDATPYAKALELKPGDINYWDRNEDGLISSLDEVVIGYNHIPQVVYGVDLGVSYKRISLSVLLQGAAKASLYSAGWASQPFNQSNGPMFRHQLDYWTPDNPDAAYPRLVSNPQGYNYYYSSHWMRSANYIRLKTATLSYDVNVAAFSKVVNKLRIYASGQNLLTISNLLGDIDPENPDSTEGYWQQKVVTMGLSVTF